MNIVEIGAHAHAEQAAAGQAVEQEKITPHEGITPPANVPPPAERAAIRPLPEPTAIIDLEEEIKMVRKAANRVAQLLEDSDPERLIRILNTLSVATTRVATLLRVQRVLTGKEGELKEMFQQVLSETREELEAEGQRLTDDKGENSNKFDQVRRKWGIGDAE